MKKGPSYQFVLYYFQTIMDIDFEEQDWSVIGRRRTIVLICNEYKNKFGLQAYSTRQIWDNLKRKHNKWFDEMLGDTMK